MKVLVSIYFCADTIWLMGWLERRSALISNSGHLLVVSSHTQMPSLVFYALCLQIKTGWGDAYFLCQGCITDADSEISKFWLVSEVVFFCCLYVDFHTRVHTFLLLHSDFSFLRLLIFAKSLNHKSAFHPSLLAILLVNSRHRSQHCNLTHFEWNNRNLNNPFLGNWKQNMRHHLWHRNWRTLSNDLRLFRGYGLNKTWLVQMRMNSDHYRWSFRFFIYLLKSLHQVVIMPWGVAML